MSPLREQLVGMIDCLAENEQVLVMEILKRFIPDDIATPDDVAAIQKADEEFSRGEFVRHEDIDWR